MVGLFALLNFTSGDFVGLLLGDFLGLLLGDFVGLLLGDFVGDFEDLDDDVGLAFAVVVGKPPTGRLVVGEFVRFLLGELVVGESVGFDEGLGDVGDSVGVAVGVAVEEEVGFDEGLAEGLEDSEGLVEGDAEGPVDAEGDVVQAVNVRWTVVIAPRLSVATITRFATAPSLGVPVDGSHSSLYAIIGDNCHARISRHS